MYWIEFSLESKKSWVEIGLVQFSPIELKIGLSQLRFRTIQF